MTANQCLSFVNLHCTSKLNNEAVRTIRANVMRWHQRAKYDRIQKQKLEVVPHFVLPGAQKTIQSTSTKQGLFHPTKPEGAVRRSSAKDFVVIGRSENYVAWSGRRLYSFVVFWPQGMAHEARRGGRI